MPKACIFSYCPPSTLCGVTSVNPSQLMSFSQLLQWFGYLWCVGPGCFWDSKPSVLGTALPGRAFPSPAPRCCFPLTTVWPCPNTEHARNSAWHLGRGAGLLASRYPGSATWLCPQGVRVPSSAAPALICSGFSATQSYLLLWLPLVDYCSPHLLHPPCTS